MAHSACVILSPLDDRYAALGYSLILVFGTALVSRARRISVNACAAKKGEGEEGKDVLSLPPPPLFSRACVHRNTFGSETSTAPVLRTLVHDVVTVTHQTLPSASSLLPRKLRQKLPASVRLRSPNIRGHASPRAHFTEHAYRVGKLKDDWNTFHSSFGRAVSWRTFPGRPTGPGQPK